MKEIKKVYLGDAVYANYDGYHIVLTTEDGYETSNTICLDSDVLYALDEYKKEIVEMLKSLDNQAQS